MGGVPQTNHQSYLRQLEGACDSLLRKVDVPLSQQAPAMFRTSTREMEDWVLRTSDVRYEESKRRGGRITRPLNCYIAYRTVFAALLKVLSPDQYKCQKTVSKMAAISWRAEPRGVKDEYKRLAKMEKSEHMQAFPSYKLQQHKSKDRQSPRRPNGRQSHSQSDENGGTTPSDRETAASVCVPPGLCTNTFQDALYCWPGMDEDLMPLSLGSEPLTLYQGFFDLGGSFFGGNSILLV